MSAGRLLTLSSPFLVILPHMEATNMDLRGSPARSVSPASPKGLPSALGISMDRCPLWERSRPPGATQPFAPPLTFRRQLCPGVVVHLDGVRLETQDWGATGTGGIGGGTGRDRERSVSTGEVWMGHEGRLLGPPSCPLNSQGSSATRETLSSSLSRSS